MDTHSMRPAVQRFYAEMWNRHDNSKIPSVLQPILPFEALWAKRKAATRGLRRMSTLCTRRLATTAAISLIWSLRTSKLLRVCDSMASIAGDFSATRPLGSASNGQAPRSLPSGKTKSPIFGCLAICMGYCNFWNSRRMANMALDMTTAQPLWN